MLHSLLKFISNRTHVRSKSVPLMLRYLRVDLEEKGFREIQKISDQVGTIIVEEALQRAAAKEKDGRPRFGEFRRQIELAADSVVAAFSGSAEADPRIKSLLVFHKVI